MRVQGVEDFNRGLWVHSHAPWVSLGSSGVVGFTHAHRGGRCVHLGSLGSLSPALRTSDSFGVAGFIRSRPGGRSVHPGSLDASYMQD